MQFCSAFQLSISPFLPISMMQVLGRHIVVEFYDCDPEVINDVRLIEQAMVGAAEKANATVISSSFHHFSPFGVSGVVVIQESHLAIHTWPEYGYAAVDVFTCGEVVDPWVCYRHLFEHLKAGSGSAIEMGRGQEHLLERKFELSHFQKAGVTQNVVQEVDKSRVVWFTERDRDIALSLRHTGEMLYREQSPYQKVEVFDTYAYGKLLTLDGAVMTTEKDEYVYHEMITHVPMLLHKDPKRMLVIGGGDGGVVREAVRHEGLEQVVMVEIDALVLEASRIHLPEIASALDHPKLDLRVADGIDYVRNAPDASFDIVIVDSTDPVGPGQGLFTAEFYQHVYRILKPEGLMVTQSESPRFNTAVFQEIYQCYFEIFGRDNVHCYQIQVPTYPSGTWSLSFSTKGGTHPLHDFDSAKAAAFTRKHNLRYYNESIHPAAFALPNFVRELIYGQAFA
jgi:spermidine synthase